MTLDITINISSQMEIIGDFLPFEDEFIMLTDDFILEIICNLQRLNTINNLPVLTDDDTDSVP